MSTPAGLAGIPNDPSQFGKENRLQLWHASQIRVMVSAGAPISIDVGVGYAVSEAEARLANRQKRGFLPF